MILSVAVLFVVSCNKEKEHFEGEIATFDAPGYSVATIKRGTPVYSDDTEYAVDTVSTYFNGFQMLVCAKDIFPGGTVTPTTDGMVYLSAKGVSLPDGWKAVTGNQLTIRNTSTDELFTMDIYFRIAYADNPVEIPVVESSDYPIIPIARIFKQK